MVIFRENTEDIYAGIEFEAGSESAQTFLAMFRERFPKEFKKVRFPEECGIGIKAVSREGSERLIRAAIRYALEHKRKSVTFVHKGNIMKFTEGAFRDWGYALAEREFGGQGLHLGAVGGDQGEEGRGRGQRRAEGGARLREAPDQGRHRRHHACSRSSPGPRSSTSSPRST